MKLRTWCEIVTTIAIALVLAGAVTALVPNQTTEPIYDASQDPTAYEADGEALGAALDAESGAIGIALVGPSALNDFAVGEDDLGNSGILAKFAEAQDAGTASNRLVLVNLSENVRAASHWIIPNGSIWADAPAKLAAAGFPGVSDGLGNVRYPGIRVVIFSPLLFQVPREDGTNNALGYFTQAQGAGSDVYAELCFAIMAQCRAAFPDLEQQFGLTPVLRLAQNGGETLADEPWAGEWLSDVARKVHFRLIDLPHLYRDGPFPAGFPQVDPPRGPYAWTHFIQTWAPEGVAGSAPDDPLLWEQADFQSDGVHPSNLGADKMGDFLVQWFTTSPFTPWAVGDGAAPPPPPGPVVLASTDFDDGNLSGGTGWPGAAVASGKYHPNGPMTTVVSGQLSLLAYDAAENEAGGWSRQLPSGATHVTVTVVSGGSVPVYDFVSGSGPVYFDTLVGPGTYEIDVTGRAWIGFGANDQLTADAVLDDIVVEQR